MSTAVKWNFEADFIQACNCDYGCPCEFSAPPTPGFCEGMVAWHINKGHYGDVKLDGLGLAFAVHWPKAIHQGNGTAAALVDERANPQQRDALLQIASGKAGGMPFEIIVTTFSKMLDPQFAPFKFDINGRNSGVQIGSLMNIAVEPIKNPVTGDPESVRVHHATGFIFKEAECVSAAKMDVNVGELKYSYPNKAAFVARVKYGN
jgi:hypothetical protein